MKKLVLFMLIATLGVALTSCSCFDSQPVNPQIIGYGYLQYDAEKDLHYVTIDSVSFIIDEVTIPDSNTRTASVTQDIDAVDGMAVTIFTYSRSEDIKAVAGNQTVEEIEDLYRENYSFTVFFMVLVMVWFVMAFYYELKPNKK
jgi:hypothetical protein